MLGYRWQRPGQRPDIATVKYSRCRALRHFLTLCKLINPQGTTQLSQQLKSSVGVSSITITQDNEFEDFFARAFKVISKEQDKECLDLMSNKKNEEVESTKTFLTLNP